MGAPYNHLQQLSGLSPVRKIGTDDLKNFYFSAERPKFNFDFNINVSGIVYDREEFKAVLKSGSFTPAVRDDWSLKSFTSGNVRWEPMDAPLVSVMVTGGPREIPFDTPSLRMFQSGSFYKIATETGYLGWNWRGEYDSFWHEESSLKQQFSGDFYKYDQDPLLARFVFLTGEITAEHAPVRRDSETIVEKGLVLSYYFVSGQVQGGTNPGG